MNKIIYLSMAIAPDDLTDEAIARVRDDALAHVRSLTTSMRILSRSSGPVAIDVDIDVNPKIPLRFYNAYTGKADDSLYRIRIGAGLLLQLEVFARAMVADSTVLKGMGSAQLQTNEARKLGRPRILHDFFFHFMIGAVFWHELAHVLLGHLDWLGKHAPEASMLELPMKVSHDKLPKETRYLEYDADRQSSKWLLAALDWAFSNNDLLRYPENSDRYYDFGFMLGFVFRAFDAMESAVPDCERVHPDNTVRTIASLHYLDEYFEKYRPRQVAQFRDACFSGAQSALKYALHAEMKWPDENETKLTCALAEMTIGTLDLGALRPILTQGETTFIIGKTTS